ncbi:Variant surface glycoprotein [Trypanosoma congolense IL3000]|uniref:Variant surface glycoprotein n=1 Tax=Trypanosoma congolense (strain IL3000) TaxID=1068625 RepID=F9WK76_TRYCI|nr:Variant surface glycoprotein [Trypanosoma congolense IL3000]
MMKVVMVMALGILCVGAKNHNEEAHRALCDLLQAAVGKWGSSGEGLSEPMKAALGITIFGNEKGGVLGELESLPGVYKNVEGTQDSRGNWCGQPQEDGHNGINQGRSSGHSAPHGLLCLCTVGEKGWPVNESETVEERLCGHTKQTLGASDNEGWVGSKSVQGEKHVSETWKEVVIPCLKGERGKELKPALHSFLGKLENKSGDWYSSRYQLGEGEPSNERSCTGTQKHGVCVMYYNFTGGSYPMPWWTELENAIQEDEKLQKQREEEERRKHKEEANKKEDPRAEASKSGHPTTNQTDQQNTGTNFTNTLRKFNLTSGTPISMPSSWLLSVAILI